MQQQQKRSQKNDNDNRGTQQLTRVKSTSTVK